MANLRVNTRVTAPENIEIPLVRADILHVSQTFRTFFEVFLSLTSMLGGYVLSLPVVSGFQWLVLTVATIATLAFLALSLKKQRDATIAA